MTDAKPSNLPFVLMLVWYAFLLIGSGFLLLIGMAFGSEAYRDRGIPVMEWLIIGSPFVIAVALLSTTIWLWTKAKYGAAYMLCGLSVVLPLLSFAWYGGLAI